VTLAGIPIMASGGLGNIHSTTTKCNGWRKLKPI
jgi:hypothetical protein